MVNAQTYSPKDESSLIQKARHMCSDPKIKPSYEDSFRITLAPDQAETRRILGRASKLEYLLPEDFGRLAKLVAKYEQIVQLNNSYEPDLRDSAVSAIEQVLSLAEKFSDSDIGRLGIKRRHIIVRAEQIRQGEYFWYSHIRTALDLLRDIRALGVQVDGDLERKIEGLIERTSLENAVI